MTTPRPTAFRIRLALSLTAFTLGGTILAGGVEIDKLRGIYATSQPTPIEAKARTVLIGGFQKLYGARPKVAADGTGPVIILGRRAALETKAATAAELDATAPGGYLIRVADNRIVVAGGDDVGTYWGAFGLLQRLGTYFYTMASAKSVVRQPAKRVVPDMAVSTRPAMRYRNYNSRWLYAKCNEGPDAELFKKTDLWIDHSAGYLVPKDLYYDEHPEYYAVREGSKRIGKAEFTYHRTPLCLSNPEVTAITIERLLKLVAHQPDMRFFPVTYGDTGVWCQCAPCKALDPEPGQYSTRLLTWVNAAARAVAAKYPDKIITTFAYGGSNVVPPKLRPEKNVWITSADGVDGMLFFAHEAAAGKVAKAARNLEAWLEIAPGQMMVCEYMGNRYVPCLTDYMQAKYRFYGERRTNGIQYSFGRVQNFRPVWTHLYPLLMWNPQQDALALASEFALVYYRQAGEAVVDYLELCHKQYGKTLAEKQKLRGGYPEKFYSPAFTDAAWACFSRAIAAAKAADDKKLEAEASAEARFFLMDWMAHPAGKKMDDAAKAVMVRQLDAMKELAIASGADLVAVARDLHKLGLRAESRQKGALAVVEQWLEDQGFPKPQAEVTDRGVLMPAQVWMYDGWGPRVYKGHAHGCPPKMAVAVYAKGNAQNRSHRMVAEFTFDAVPGDGAAELTLLGQDCDHDVDTAAIRILVNEKQVFTGKVQMVKWNWSMQSFAVPAGLLKAGKNEIEIQNATDAKDVAHWYERWFMLAEAKLAFKAQ